MGVEVSCEISELHRDLNILNISKQRGLWKAKLQLQTCAQKSCRSENRVENSILYTYVKGETKRAVSKMIYMKKAVKSF